MLYWTMFYTLILDLTPATWFLIVAPMVVFLIMVMLGRKSLSTIRSDGVWRMIGRKWGQVGMCMLGVAILSYGIDVGLAYYQAEYNQKFYDVLRQRTSKIGSANVRKALVREAVKQMDETALRDVANTYVASLDPEQRLPFLNSFMGSNIDAGIINWGDLLATKSGDTNKVANFALRTTIPLDVEQRKLFDAGKLAPFWTCLREEQWKYISKQMFAVQKQEAMEDILVDLVGSLNPNSSVMLARAMLNTRYPGLRQLSSNMATEAGRPDLLWLFNFLVSGIAWLRGVLWLVLWFVVGLTMVFQAGRMQSGQRLFQVQRQ